MATPFKKLRDEMRKRITWFTKVSGRRPEVIVSDCECRRYGRDFCFNCIKEVEYAERPTPISNQTFKPRWWDRYMKTRFTKKDMNFLYGYKYVKNY